MYRILPEPGFRLIRIDLNVPNVRRAGADAQGRVHAGNEGAGDVRGLARFRDETKTATVRHENNRPAGRHFPRSARAYP